jgi:hypothetical protein
MPKRIWMLIAVLLLISSVPSVLAQTAIDINTSGSAIVYEDGGTGTGGEIFTPSYYLYFMSGPDTSYSVYPMTCATGQQSCEDYNATSRPGGFVYIWNSAMTKLLYSGSFTDGTGSGFLGEGLVSATFSGDFILNGIDGTGNLNASAAGNPPIYNYRFLESSGTVTPEPGTLALLLLGVSAILGKVWLMRSA